MRTFKATVSTLSMFAVCCLLVATPQAQDADKKQPAPEAPAHKTMLLTGCLVAGPDASTFKLTRASEIAPPAPGPQAVATSGNAGEYELRAEARLDTASVAPIDMKPFVGHQVEVTVRPAEDVPATASQNAAGAPTVAPDPSKPAEKKAERFTVTAIKQVVATCK
jgi:hypothetical protein